MQIGLIGLGRMGANMAVRLRKAGIEVIGGHAVQATAAQAHQAGPSSGSGSTN